MKISKHWKSGLFLTLLSLFLTIYWHNTGLNACKPHAGDLSYCWGKQRGKSCHGGCHTISTMFQKTAALLKCFTQFFYIVLQKLIQKFLIRSQRNTISFRELVSFSVGPSFWTTPKMEQVEWILKLTRVDTIICLWGKSLSKLCKLETEMLLRDFWALTLLFFSRKQCYDLALPLLNQAQEPGKSNACKHLLKWKHSLQRMYKSLLNGNASPFYKWFSDTTQPVLVPPMHVTP